MTDISVILTIFNAKKNLDKTIECLLNQTKNSIEIICINTSTDSNISNTLHSYQKYDNRISIIDTTLTKITQTIDTLITKASSKFISFINCGDYLSEDFYEKMLFATFNNPDCIIECKNLYINKTQLNTTLLNKLFPTNLIQKNYKKCLTGFQTFENSLLKQVLFTSPTIISLDNGTCFKNSDNIPLIQKNNELIISLTSYPARIKNVHKTTNTLLNQSLKANKVILWLAENQFPNKEQDLPSKLLAQTTKGLTISWYHKDIKSYKKLIKAHTV